MSDSPAPKRPFYDPGFYRNLTNKQYHGSMGTSSSRLKTLLDKTARHYEYGLTVSEDPTAATELGSAFHTLTLEPENFDNAIVVLPELNLRKPDHRAEKLRIIQENPEKAIITLDQLAKAKRMADAARSDPLASVLLSDIVAESSVYWWYKSTDPDDDTHYREMVKVRPDALNPAHRFVIDLKSTNDPTYSSFQRTILNYYYHMSAAMYLEGVNQCQQLLDETRCSRYMRFIWIVVESDEPHTVAVYEASPKWMEIGKFLFRQAMWRLFKGRAENWPAFPDEIMLIEPPTWAERFHIIY